MTRSVKTSLPKPSKTKGSKATSVKSSISASSPLNRPSKSLLQLLREHHLTDACVINFVTTVPIRVDGVGEVFNLRTLLALPTTPPNSKT